MNVTKQQRKLLKAQMYIEKAHDLMQLAIELSDSMKKKTKAKTKKKRGRPSKKGVK